MNKRSLISIFCAVAAASMVAASDNPAQLEPVLDGTHSDQMQVEPNSTVPEQWGGVEINADSSSRVVLDALSEPSGEGVMGYRIGLFFGNSGKARSDAQGVVALCDSLYGDVVTTLSYDNPYFKVSAGYCTSLEEALRLLNRMQRSFPNAFLVNERIMPSHLVEVRHREIEWKNREKLAKLAAADSLAKRQIIR